MPLAMLSLRVVKSAISSRLRPKWLDVMRAINLQRMQAVRHIFIIFAHSVTVVTGSELATEALPKLPDPSTFADLELHAAELEVDDETNCHVDFIVAAANLRATNYGIDLADRHKIKQLAGRITPAVVTSAAIAAGLASLELIKVFHGSSTN